MTSPSQPLSASKRSYNAHAFTLALPEGWQDKTVFTLTGPVEHGVQHNVLINVEPGTPFATAWDFAEHHISALQNELKGCRLLKSGKKTLANGLAAHEAIFSWYPTNALRVYQQQIYVVHEKIAFKLTATFTKKTRKTLGPKVERMMLSFIPEKNV